MGGTYSGNWGGRHYDWVGHWFWQLGFWIYDSQFRFMFLLLSKIALQLFICRFVDVRFQNFDLGFPTYVSSDSVWTRPRSLDCSELMISAINTCFVFQLLVSVFVSFLIFSFDMLVVAWFHFLIFGITLVFSRHCPKPWSKVKTHRPKNEKGCLKQGGFKATFLSKKVALNKQALKQPFSVLSHTKG